MRPSVQWSVVCLAIAVLVVACSSSATTGSSNQGAACGGFGTSDALCNTCIQTSCCSQGSACEANAACEATFKCVQACNDDACSQACMDENPAGLQSFNAFTGCITGLCDGSCGGNATPGDAGASCGGFGFSTASCETCFASGCCSQGTACGNNAECTALFACTKQCASGDASCADACSTAHPNGTSDLNALTSCLTGPCATACQFEGSDSGTSCGGISSSDPCQSACLAGSCCSAATACGNLAECNAIIGCIGMCTPGDDTCAQSCASSNQGGVAAFNTLASCQDACNCGGTGSSSGSGSGSGSGSSSGSGSGSSSGSSAPSCSNLPIIFGAATSSCTDCAESTCCSQDLACGVVSDCVAEVNCDASCTTGPCETSCAQTHTTGDSYYNALQVCMSSSCASECYPADPNPCDGTTGFYNVCGSNSSTGDPGRLYRCNSGAVSGSVICKNGCHAAPQGEADYCVGLDPCVSSVLATDVVCGSSLSSAANPNTLYTCSGQMTTNSTVCSNGCHASAPGQSDYCQ